MVLRPSSALGSLVSVVSLVILAGCASGRVVDGLDAGRRDGGGRVDASGSACEPVCTEGFVCVDGSCRPGEVDVDGDGVIARLDCDDLDVATGSSAERACSGACGDGVERCEGGVWGACSAPTSCDCETGAMPRMVPCPRCGTQRQICVGNRWTNDGACMSGSCAPGEVEMGAACGNCGVQARVCGADCTWGPWMCAEEGECARGAVETETEACGLCGTGTRTRMRTCGSDCRWSPATDWSVCGGESVECRPGETQSETGACGNCDLGRRTRTRSCSATTCTWGPWGDWGACSGGGVCAPGATRACANGDSCGLERCSGTCSWGSCEPRTAGGCLRIRPGTSGPEGNNYRCCRLSSTDDGWQFCLPSCAWSTACEPTTAC
jgi:hypothetical protein